MAIRWSGRKLNAYIEYAAGVTEVADASKRARPAVVQGTRAISAAAVRKAWGMRTDPRRSGTGL